MPHASRDTAWWARVGRRADTRALPRALVFALALSTVASTGALGQGSRYRGYWGSLGLGGGIRIVSVGGETETTAGGAMSIRMGGKLSDVLLLGGEIGGWGREEDQLFVSRGNWTVTAVVLPAERLGLLVKGGVGGATVRAVDHGSLGEPQSVTKAGFGATLGIGYDLAIAPSASLTPGLDFLYQWVDDPDARSGGLLLLTIGVTWH